MPAVESENGGRVGIKLHELPEVCLASQAKAAVFHGVPVYFMCAVDRALLVCLCDVVLAP